MVETLISTFSLFDENGNELKINLTKKMDTYKVKLFFNGKIEKSGEEYTCSSKAAKAEAFSIYNYMIDVATKDMLY